MGYRKSPEERYHLLITWKCNLRCPGCLYEKNLGSMHIPLRTIKKLTPTMTRFHEVCIAGGEPTLHPQFWKIIELIAKREPKNIQIVTNGYSFTGSGRKVRDFFSRLERISKTTGVKFGVEVSVDDFHLRRLKGKAPKEWVMDLRARAKRIAENLPRGKSIDFAFGTSLAPGQKERAVVAKYGLPQGLTSARAWEYNPPGGTMPSVVVTPRGDVFIHERAAKANANPIGSLRKESMRAIMRRHCR